MALLSPEACEPTHGSVISPDCAPAAMSDRDLVASTRSLAARSCTVEAELLVHLGEIDRRRLYLDFAFPSMFAFCVGELGFSEDAAYNRISVARAGRRWPAVVEALRLGQVHLAGLRLLAPRLTDGNNRDVLSLAARKSKREIEEIVARLAPQPPAEELIRKLAGLSRAAAGGPAPAFDSALVPPLKAAAHAAAAQASWADGAAAQPQERRAVVTPLSAETFKFQFTGSRALRDKLRQAQDLLRHRIPNGDLAAVIERAVEVLIEAVQKERFATGRKPRNGSRRGAGGPPSRHIPASIKRAVFERDGGRCTFRDERGRRCAETGALEFDHRNGFARTHLHDVDGIRLLCRPHNQHVAEQLYGRAFMEQARRPRRPRHSSRDSSRDESAAGPPLTG